MKRRQRGSATLETALMLSVVIICGLLAVDLYLLARGRADLERSTSMLASTLSNQTRLTAKGVDALVAELVAERGDNYQLYVGKVMRTGKVAWRLPLGQTTGLCDDPMGGGMYDGTLPESDDEADDSVALLVVRACQSSDEMGMSTLSLGGKVLQADAISRLRSANIELDDSLSALAGITPTDGTE